MNNSDKEIKKTLERFGDKINSALDECYEFCEKFIKDRNVRITAKIFRDQKYGDSKPNLSGKVFEVEFCIIHQDKVYLKLDGVRNVYAKTDEVEFI